MSPSPRHTTERTSFRSTTGTEGGLDAINSPTETSPRAINVIPQAGVRTDQTMDLTNITRLLRNDIYRAPSETAPHGSVLCPDQKWHHVIGHDTAIDDGVHISYGLNQNIVVDYESDPVLQTLYPYAEATLGAADTQHPTELGREQLQEFSALIRRFLPYDEQKVADYLRSLSDKPQGEFQKLGDFVRMSVEDGRVRGAGVCLHQALLAGVLLEHAVRTGAVEGSVSVFRNHDTDAGSAHAWVIYTGPTDILIIDPANASVASISDESEWAWRYGVTADV